MVLSAILSRALPVVTVALILLSIHLDIQLNKTKGELAWCEMQHAKFVEQIDKKSIAALEAARKAEAAWQADHTRLEQELLDAQQQNDKLEVDVADAVRVGNLRLRQSFCSNGRSAVPAVTGTASQVDASANDGAARASRIVRAAAECDTQVKGLQEVIRSYRKEGNSGR